MATTFYANKPVNAKPMHNGAVTYADDTCIRAITSELLGGGGGVEMIAPFFLLFGIIPLAWFWFVEDKLDIFSLYPLGFGFLLLILPIIIFRYKPNYLVFSRKSQEIYYVKSPKNIIKFNWLDVKSEYRGVAVFSGSAVSQINTLTLIGTNKYGNKPPESAVIGFVVIDETDAKEFWSYLQTYMKNGADGLEKPYYYGVKDGFIPEAKRIIKRAFYTLPKDEIETIFLPRSKTPIWLRILLLLLAIPTILVGYIIVFPGEIARAFVGSTRKRAPFPDELLPYVTDNPESWGKRK